MLRTYLLTFVLLSQISAAAPPPSPALDRLWLREFCAEVEAEWVERTPVYPYIRYTYETRLVEAAGVLPTDSRETAYDKFGRFMDRNMGELLCNQFNFNPRNGNVLKLAVAKNSRTFVRDALEKWRITNVNQIDQTDGKTVLDYIQDRLIAAGPETSLGRTLKRYYDQFRAAGALHAAEVRAK